MRLPALLAVLLTLHAPRPAEACSAPRPIPAGVPFGFDDGAVLPTNARPALLFAPHRDEDLAQAEKVELLDEGGAPVAVTVEIAAHHNGGEVAYLVPIAPLTPGATYRVADHVCETDGCNPEEPQVRASFTVGPEADQTAPGFAGVVTLEVGEIQRCEDEACCGPFVLYFIGGTWPLASEAARYEVRDPAGALVTATSIPLLYTQQVC